MSLRPLWAKWLTCVAGRSFGFPVRSLFSNQTQIVDLAAAHRLSMMYNAREFDEIGGLTPNHALVRPRADEPYSPTAKWKLYGALARVGEKILRQAINSGGFWPDFESRGSSMACLAC
jgi:hypothetical protein